MILMTTKMVWSITLGIPMTIISQRIIYRRRPAPDLGAVDTTQQKQCSILREGDVFLVRSSQAFRGEMTLPMGLEFPQASTHLKMLERIHDLFPEIAEGVQWDLTEGLPGKHPFC